MRKALPGEGEGEGGQDCRHHRPAGSDEQRRQARDSQPGEGNGERERRYSQEAPR